MIRSLSFVLICLLASAACTREPQAAVTVAPENKFTELCINQLKALPGKHNAEVLPKACASAAVLPECKSVQGEPIFHYDRLGTSKDARRILTFSLIHGDEMPSGSVARSWIERLASIDPRNSWRIVPILNPDGLKKRTRMNANGIDLNRNFPTHNWEKEAPIYWEKQKKDPRRFPGHHAASEPETLCAMKHIEEFDPAFIISLHTPYGVLDFDGPPIQFPKFAPLPWQSLGNYPGSLGRYMWHDRKHPVLTVELRDKGVVEQMEVFDRLQDITSDVATKSENVLRNPQSKPQSKPQPKTKAKAKAKGK